ncbi:MAG: GWxTD domain-containing protein [candidate division Zixibacteria bacterium]|nr:GWxTD domain-containing protein [candidate division Zixibacteria bacterium]
MKEKIFLLVLSIFLLVTKVSFSQTDFGYTEESEEQGFLMDYAYFTENQSDDWRVEVYYKIFNNALTFVKDQDRFKARYEIEIVLFAKNKQVNASSHEEEYIVESYEETQSSVNFLINQINLNLPEGEYKLSVKLIDKNSQKAIKQEHQLTLQSLEKNKITFSGLELARSIEEKPDSSKFNKRGQKVIPSVSATFGDPENLFWVYLELYNLKLSGTLDYLLIYEIEANNKAIVYSDTSKITQLSKADQILYEFKKIQIDGIANGLYNLRVLLLNEKGKEITKTQKELEIKWSLLYQLKADYQQAVDLMRYVANTRELNELKEVEGEERIKKWQEFWKSKDPTPDTPENELKDEYYKRVGYANAHFRIYDKEGYKTDMGMVYIKFGAPDEVDRHPFELNSRPYQIWYYYRLNRRFLFVDVTGYGEYELQYPYKEGRQ